MTKKLSMRFLPLLLFALVLGDLNATAADELPSDPQTGRPNILFIYLDDFGWKDTGFMGSDFYETPNLDRLANSGMVFTNAYSGAANCAPARACLLSGQYTPRHQIYNVGTRPRGKTQHRRLEHVAGVESLDPKIRTWAQQIQEGGYATASIGKWHLSDDPIPSGFDVNVGGTHSGSPPKGYYPPHNNIPSLANAPPDEYLTDRLTDESCKFIANNKDRPWLLYLTHFAVHTPLNAKKELVAKYRSKPPGQLHNHVAMATMVQAVDDGVGKIIDQLNQLGIRENTVILFSSDNGGYGPATDMDPLKGYKGVYYEGGIRVPFFVNWPGAVRPGSSCDQPITGVDFYSTLCEIAQVDLPEHQANDGVSLVPLFHESASNLNDADGPRSIYWHFPAYLEAYSVWDEQQDPLFRSRPCSVVRKGNWKLMQFFETDTAELYDLAGDIGETTNVAAKFPEITRMLLDDLQTWQTKVQAAIPSEPNPGFDPELEKAATKSKRNSGKRNPRGRRGNRKRRQR